MPYGTLKGEWPANVTPQQLDGTPGDFQNRLVLLRHLILDPHPASLRSATLPLRGRDKSCAHASAKLRRGAAERDVNCFLSTCSNPTPEGGGWPPKRSAAKR